MLADWLADQSSDGTAAIALAPSDPFPMRRCRPTIKSRHHYEAVYHVWLRRALNLTSGLLD